MNKLIFFKYLIPVVNARRRREETSKKREKQDGCQQVQKQEKGASHQHQEGRYPFFIISELV